MAAPNSLYKQRSWSPGMGGEEVWLRRKRSNRIGKSKSVTDDDLEELKACIELGFGFNSPDYHHRSDQRLAHTLPALGFYYAVNKHYSDSLSQQSPLQSTPSDFFGPDDTPQTVKTRLRQWAQVVACSVKEGSN